MIKRKNIPIDYLDAKPTDFIRGHSRGYSQRFCSAFLLLLIFTTVAVHAQSVEAILYDTTLEPTAITMTALDHEHVVYLDAAGEEHEIPLSEILRLDFPIDPEKISRGLESYPVEHFRRSVLTTTDGQRFVFIGDIEDDFPLRFDSSDADADPDPETLHWNIDLGLNRVEVSLDDIYSVRFDSSVALQALSSDDDVLTLVNGDCLIGYIEGVTRDGVGFTIGDANAPVVFAFDRVAAIQFANPLVTPPREGVWVTSAYGSFFRCRIDHTEVFNAQYGLELWMEPELVPGVAEAASDRWGSNIGIGIVPHESEVYGDTITRLDFALGGFRVQPLAEMSMTMVSGGEVFGQPMPPQERDGVVVLQAPVEVAYTLPANARRLVMTAALSFDEEVPTSRRAWASCELVILRGEVELYRQTFETFETSQPDQRINLVLPDGDGDLTIRLESGINGPVLDRIMLRDAEVLIEYKE